MLQNDDKAKVEKEIQDLVEKIKKSARKAISEGISDEQLIEKVVNVTIKKIAKIIAETKGGHFRIFCNAIETIIVAIGKAKNISNVIFIYISPSFFTIFYA